MTGLKYDDGKTAYALLPWHVLRGAARVLTYGAAKYAPNNWQLVSDPLARYKSALDRHWDACVHEGETCDPESGIEHAFHYACNALFLSWFMAFRPDLLAEYRARFVPAKVEPCSSTPS